MRHAVHGEGVEPDLFFHDVGNCCIPPGFSKTNCRRRAHFRPAPYLDTVAELAGDRDKTNMTRADAIARARQHLHSGGILAELDRRVAYPTESQNPERREAL